MKTRIRREITKRNIKSGPSHKVVLPLVHSPHVSRELGAAFDVGLIAGCYLDVELVVGEVAHEFTARVAWPWRVLCSGTVDKMMRKQNLNGCTGD